MEQMGLHLRTFNSFMNVDEYHAILVPTDKMDEIKRRLVQIPPLLPLRFQASVEVTVLSLIGPAPQVHQRSCHSQVPWNQTGVPGTAAHSPGPPGSAQQ